MNDNIDVEFQECPTCAAKTGMPILCDSCLHNRQAIAIMKEALSMVITLTDELKELIK